jgi:hypothetical protein
MELVKNIFTSGLGMGTGAISDTVVRYVSHLRPRIPPRLALAYSPLTYFPETRRYWRHS